MDRTVEYRGIAKVLLSGRSQAVRLPAPCRFDVSEVEVIKEGNCLTLRPRGKNWGAYFDSPTRGSLPDRREPPLDERERIGRCSCWTRTSASISSTKRTLEAWTRSS